MGSKEEQKGLGGSRARGKYYPQRDTVYVLGCWVWWAILLFLSTHPPSFMIDPLIFSHEELHDQQQKGRETEKRRKEWQQSSASRTGHWLQLSKWSATTLSTHSPEWYWAALGLAYHPSQTTSRQNAFQDKLTVWILKHLEYFTSLNKITSIMKELALYYDKLN